MAILAQVLPLPRPGRRLLRRKSTGATYPHAGAPSAAMLSEAWARARARRTQHEDAEEPREADAEEHTDDTIYTFLGIRMDPTEQERAGLTTVDAIAEWVGLRGRGDDATRFSFTSA